MVSLNVNFLTFMNENPKGLYVVTGEIGTGKSVFLQAMLEDAQKMEMECAGILTPGVFVEREKVGILMHDVARGEERTFARKIAYEEGCEQMRMGQWCMDEETLAWGNAILAEIRHSQVLFVDELGPLELRKGKGLMAGVSLLAKGAFDYGFGVVRPSLLKEAEARFDVRGVIDLDVGDIRLS